ncbi:hypothetical protein C0V73_11615 [Rhizobium sp. TH135]|uniref:winged helix-turn-helix domain-containing protein n=1 Tax=Rhizobium sp. TH135 TaxID=2067451 RepID=UPI000C7A1DD6|nr:winged helix-turn-helix domain-containing protein [Rhizobium sp. TH135]PLK71239.1 hypothetical protein C0V73_11615 [Rhizobium sp. TH135]
MKPPYTTSAVVGTQRYKAVAELALRILGRPATAGEIVDCILQHKELSQQIAGRTPHKTIQARLSTDIRKNGSQSRFYRYAPATFGLRELAEGGAYDRSYRRIYIGRDRRREVDQTPVMCALKEDMNLRLHNKIMPSDVVPMRYWRSLRRDFFPKGKVDRTKYLEIQLFIVIRHKNSVICYMPTEFDEKYKETANFYSVGISGSIKEDDIDLFDQSGVGFENANVREISNFFYFLPNELGKSIEKISYLGVVSDQISPERHAQIGIVSQVSIKDEFALSNSILGITNLEWRGLQRIPNSFDHMDAWSKYTFRLLHEQLLSEDV